LSLPPEVYYSNAGLAKGIGGPSQKLLKILETSNLSQIVNEGNIVALKMHLGEPGNSRYIRPILAVIVVDYIKMCGGRPFVTDTTVMYNTDRKDFFKYLDAARRNGFTSEVLGCPLIISGGFRDHGVRVKVPDPLILEEVTISQEIWDADVLFSLAHATMHLQFPFAAALKNISMGCVDKKTKTAMHSVKKFTPIHLNTQAANTDGAKVVIEHFNEKIFACNLALDITPECDCFDKTDLPIVPDIGIFASDNPSACDQATFDAIMKAPGYPGSILEGKDGMRSGGDKVVGCHHSQQDYKPYFNFLDQAGIGSPDYELVEVC